MRFRFLGVFYRQYSIYTEAKYMKKLLSLIHIFLVAFTTCICVGCNSKKKVKINFMVDDSIYSTVTYNGKDAIVMPDNPTKDDYIFEGWYWDKDTWKNSFTENSLLNMSLSPVMEVYAHFIDESYLKSTEINVKTAQKVNIDGIGDVFYLTVRNNQMVCKLFDYIETNPHSTWTISRDITGTTLITSKTIELFVGDSPVYYIFVTDKNGKMDTYFLMVHRNYLYSVVFNTNGGSSCETQQIEEGFYLENIPSSIRTGYVFNGWDYDFKNQPIRNNIYANALWNAISYIVSFNPNNGTISSSSQSVTYGQYYSLLTPQRHGYTFMGWKTSDNTLFPNIVIWNTAHDVSLIATWEIIIYSITYELNGGIISGSTSINSYTVEDTITLPNATREGYIFDGWSTSSDLSDSVVDFTIMKGTIGDLTLYAKWEGITYQITYDVNEGAPLQSNTQYVVYDSTYTLIIPARVGYTFDGWYDGTTLVSNNGIWKYTSDKILVAHWSIIHYQINYNLNNGINNANNPSSYTVLDEIIFREPSRAGYTFSGWYCENNQITYIGLGSTGEKTLTAHWTAILNNLLITSENETKGTVSIISGSGYSDETITIKATPADNCVFDGWYHETTEVSLEETYTFKMPINDYSLTAHFLTNEEKWNIDHGVVPKLNKDGKTLTFGLYPQANVNDSALIEQLNSIASPTLNDWYLYNGEYYAKATSSPYSTSYTFDNGNRIYSGISYWYKCEAISWNIFSQDNNTYFLYSTLLIDSKPFHETISERTINETTIYANNYLYSDIREWLNNDFYNLAFAFNNSCIQTTEVDNAQYYSGYDSMYSCENTFDKVFLLSYSQFSVLKGNCGTDKTINSRTTDWARANKCELYKVNDKTSNFWTRTPANTPDAIKGHLTTNGIGWGIEKVNSTKHCVRPAITLQIT